MKYKDQLKNVDYINLDAPDTRTTVSLLLYAENIDIQEITKALGCEPTEAHRKGDVIKKRPPAPVGLWELAAPKNLTFTDQLSYLIKTTTSDISAWDELRPKYDIQLRCAIFLHSWTDGWDFPAELVAEIGKRHWKLGLAVYSAGGDEIVGAFLKRKKGNSEKNALFGNGDVKY